MMVFLKKLGQKKYLIILAVLVIFFFIFLLKNKTNPGTKIVIGKTQIAVEIADTIIKHKKGLSGRKALDPNSGMLFIFPIPGKYPFWMKDMLFNLDFVWINNKKVVQISQNIKALESPEQPVIVNSSQEVDMVLEVPSGFIEKNNIKIGDELKFLN